MSLFIRFVFCFMQCHVCVLYNFTSLPEVRRAVGYLHRYIIIHNIIYYHKTVYVYVLSFLLSDLRCHVIWSSRHSWVMQGWKPCQPRKQWKPCRMFLVPTFSRNEHQETREPNVTWRTMNQCIIILQMPHPFPWCTWWTGTWNSWSKERK